MTATTPDDDPGWGRPGLHLLAFLVPGGAALATRRAGRGDALVLLRQLWLSFVSAIVLFGIVVALVVPGSETSPAGPWALALVVIGLVCLAVTARLGSRPLQCPDPEALATSYRTRFFLRLASSELAALIGFVASFVAGHWWMYLIGAAVTLIGFALNAPTRGRLAADQVALQTAGCPHSLVAALRASSPR